MFSQRWKLGTGEQDHDEKNQHPDAPIYCRTDKRVGVLEAGPHRHISTGKYDSGTKSEKESSI